MKNIINKLICLIIGHNYCIQETFRRIGTNEYYKAYKCKRCGKIFHEITQKINP